MTSPPSSATTSGVDAGVLRHPVVLLGGGPLDEVEGDRRPDHLGVVDRADRLGVFEARRANLHADDTTEPARGRRGPATPGTTSRVICDPPGRR